MKSVEVRIEELNHLCQELLHLAGCKRDLLKELYRVEYEIEVMDAIEVMNSTCTDAETRKADAVLRTYENHKYRTLKFSVPDLKADIMMNDVKSGIVWQKIKALQNAIIAPIETQRFD